MGEATGYYEKREEELGEEAMPRGKIDDAAAAKDAPRPPRHLPGFVELLPGKATRMADRASDAIEQRPAGEATEVAIGEAAAR